MAAVRNKRELNASVRGALDAIKMYKSDVKEELREYKKLARIVRDTRDAYEKTRIAAERRGSSRNEKRNARAEESYRFARLEYDRVSTRIDTTLGFIEREYSKLIDAYRSLSNIKRAERVHREYDEYREGVLKLMEKSGEADGYVPIIDTPEKTLDEDGPDGEPAPALAPAPDPAPSVRPAAVSSTVTSVTVAPVTIDVTPIVERAIDSVIERLDAGLTKKIEEYIKGFNIPSDGYTPGRQKIDTFCVTGAYRQRIYNFLRKEIAAGRQAYIICSMVEQNDTIPDDRAAATAYAAMLSEQVFPDLHVACVHGRMKSKEKDKVMSAFAAGEIDILVSTTVVEVGVDVPNSTVMVVEDADRFGLSQLHQLRGRVGRGQHKSYCILISDNKNDDTRQRLSVMAKTSDGFKIAEEDLKLRGPGDFFGQRQHGLPTLKVADLSCDMALLKEAQGAAHELLRIDPELAHHHTTAQRIKELFDASAEMMN